MPRKTPARWRGLGRLFVAVSSLELISGLHVLEDHAVKLVVYALNPADLGGHITAVVALDVDQLAFFK